MLTWFKKWFVRKPKSPAVDPCAGCWLAFEAFDGWRCGLGLISPNRKHWWFMWRRSIYGLRRWYDVNPN